jgi:hypothetical protein
MCALPPQSAAQLGSRRRTSHPRPLLVPPEPSIHRRLLVSVVMVSRPVPSERAVSVETVFSGRLGREWGEPERIVSVHARARDRRPRPDLRRV